MTFIEKQVGELVKLYNQTNGRPLQGEITQLFEQSLTLFLEEVEKGVPDAREYDYDGGAFDYSKTILDNLNNLKK